jgi:hypothetical protein
MEKDLKKVLANPAKYSVSVLQREHQRYRGSSPVYQITDGERAVAILKCNSTAGTDVKASYATYELSRTLGLTTYSVTVLATPEFLSELRRTSEGAFDYSRDDCALKEYHVFGGFVWKEQKDQHFYRNLDPEKWALRNAIRCDQPLPGNAADPGSFYIEGEGAESRHYRSPTTLVRAAKDLSSLMLMDAIVGNGDRFIAGENLHFRSQSGGEGHREGSHWVFDDVRFLSIDNGTTFKKSKRPRRLLAHVTRFDREFVDRVREVAARPKDPEWRRTTALRRNPYIDIKSSDGRHGLDFALDNLSHVVDHIRDAEARCGAKAYFP